ncbi:MAG TPA: response regulator [Planctomycetaceae bacterium]|nr:response regulator [Planctomycetaceae bacterium]
MPADGRAILIVEDNCVMADIMRFNFKRAGFDVTVAVNGRDGLERIRDRQFDLIIADYQMPRMNGEEFCRQVRQDERHAATPTFLCTAKGFELDTVQLSQELGITRILIKPFSPRELVEAARDVLAGPPDARERCSVRPDRSPSPAG